VTSVEDSGPGIPASILPTIFQPLTTTKAGGIGIGLSVCRRIVESLGGRIGAARESSDAQEGGACVWFRLPVAGAEGVDA
jgi:two-component system sensor kinase FixL